jgi:PAS domain S-box-containing protein
MDFSKAFDYIASPLSIAEPESPNNLVYVNRAYCELTGYSPKELIGINPGALLQRDYVTPLSKRQYIRNRLNAHVAIDVLVRNFRKDGSMFWNELHIHPVIDIGGTCIYWVGIACDVTEHVSSISDAMEAISTVVKDSFHNVKEGLREI